MRHYSVLAVLAATTALTLPHLALAADTIDATNEVDQIVVTAGRAADKLSEVPVSMTIIDAEHLRSHQAVVISDLLSRTPGVTVTRNGGVGGSTQVRIRGAESDQTAVLIDGVKLNDPSSTGGGYDFATQLAGNLSRIEVLRGPQSTLWGSQAIGGVVNMITETPKGALSTSVALEGGSRATAYGRVGVGAGGDWGGWRLAAGSYTTAGISNFNETRGGKEKDGYHNASISGRLDLNVTSDLALDARASYAAGRNEYDGSSPAPPYALGDSAEYGRTKELVSYLGGRLSSFGGALNSRLGFSYTQTDRDNYDPTYSPSKTFDAKGTDGTLQYQGTWTINPIWRAVVGAETERSWFRSISPQYDTVADRHATGMDSVYGQVQAKPIAGLTLTGGVRHDDHDTFGGATTYQAGAAYSLNAGATVVRLNYGEGFKAPSLYQLFSPYGPDAINRLKIIQVADLMPEEAKSWDLAIEHTLLEGRLRGSITYFDRDTTNQIDFLSNYDLPTYGYYANTAKTRAKGVELDGAYEINTMVTVSANYTNMDATNRSPGANYGKDLARRAGETGSGDVTVNLPGGLNGGVTMQYVGHSFDNASNSRRLKSYVLTDVRLAYPINDTFEVYGRVENLFDQQYETLYRYGTLGRGAFAGVRARF
ncbi:TonB-dependent receptor plug domain-containing protein [Caulobacter sp. DWP3-1-3b2]|uniref:TonB-dependent receptor plug domain-containing protein n=1 Tax=Caulobacter sp. DWP3-1-3b2 TaxID=2804643 RepID=UPI003CEA17F4